MIYPLLCIMNFKRSKLRLPKIISLARCIAQQMRIWFGLLSSLESLERLHNSKTSAKFIIYRLISWATSLKVFLELKLNLEDHFHVLIVFDVCKAPGANYARSSDSAHQMSGLSRFCRDLNDLSRAKKHLVGTS